VKLGPTGCPTKSVMNFKPAIKHHREKASTFPQQKPEISQTAIILLVMHKISPLMSALLWWCSLSDLQSYAGNCVASGKVSLAKQVPDLRLGIGLTYQSHTKQVY
jgi:hypothetical protein